MTPYQFMFSCVSAQYLRLMTAFARCSGSTLPLPFIPTTLPSRLAPRYFSSSLPLFQQPSSSTSNTTSSPTHPASSTIQSDTTLNPNPDAKVNADAAEPPLIDHSTNRYTATLKLLNVSEGVKIMQVGPDDGVRFFSLLHLSPILKLSQRAT